MRKYLTQRFRQPEHRPEPEPVEFDPRPMWPRAWPLNDGCARPEIHNQQQSLLFENLSAEIRLNLYRAVLTDPSRFLHICRNIHWNDAIGATRPVAHFWCIDMNSPHPTWQHKCYGDSRLHIPNRTFFYPSQVTETNDQMLSLLLSCRRM
jgi:hypothetical protein